MRQLLDAGAEVFAAKGYFAARVDDIVKLAHTSHGTFYLYFSNKEDLFRALAAEVADELQALADSLGSLQPGAAGEESLRTWIERFADLYERHGPVIRGLDRSRDREPRVRPARQRRAARASHAC